MTWVDVVVVFAGVLAWRVGTKAAVMFYRIIRSHRAGAER